ncbi:hypothetical protein ACIODS_12550 [Micromonospora chalcea]|uniref:hypothetical protein n=1 Tax=Micromonospora chalcea TaxID=1874 RepID=UPI00382BF692
MNQEKRDAAVASAGAILAHGLAMRDALPPRQAAELAWTPTGPSVDELERLIRAQRAAAAQPDRSAA